MQDTLGVRKQCCSLVEGALQSDSQKDVTHLMSWSYRAWITLSLKLMMEYLMLERPAREETLIK